MASALSGPLQVVQGKKADFLRRIDDAEGEAFTADDTPFLSSDALSTKVWRGNAQTVVATVTPAWMDADAGTYYLSFAASDLASAAVGLYGFQTSLTRDGTTGVVDEGEILLQAAPPASGGTTTDLVDQSTLRLFLADYGLTDAEREMLPRLTASASKAIRRYCNRYFSTREWDELYTVKPPTTRVVLRQYPVSSVARLATNPTAAISITNTDAVTNYRATVQLVATGDVASGLTTTGVTLHRYASGVDHPTVISFDDVTTVQDLADAVAAAANGWTAAVTTGMAGWALADLRPVQGVFPALSPTSAVFRIHATDLDFSCDEQRGIVYLGRTGQSYVDDSPRFGPAWPGEFADAAPYGGSLGVRVVYTAGTDAVDDDVQHYAAEVVKCALDRLRTDSALKSESDGTLSWSARPIDELTALPPWIKTELEPFVNRRA